MIGQALVKALVDTGHGVRTLGRSARSVHGSTPFVWSPSRGEFPLEALEGVDVVVHLAAASVGQRWTGSHRRAILESRTLGTHLLREALIQKGFSGTWIQASAIGIYGHAPELCDEQSAKGQGFLAEVAEAWERASLPEDSVPFRLVRMRLGLVLSPDGGTLAKLLPIYKFGLGAPLGSGQQHMGWVHLDDVIQFIRWAAATPEVSGVYNVVAPRANTNVEFSQSLAKASTVRIGRPRSQALPSPWPWARCRRCCLKAKTCAPLASSTPDFNGDTLTCWARCNTAPPDRTNVPFGAFKAKKKAPR